MEILRGLHLLASLLALVKTAYITQPSFLPIRAESFHNLFIQKKKVSEIETQLWVLTIGMYLRICIINDYDHIIK